MAGGEGSGGLCVLHEGEGSQVVATGELVVTACVAVVHQAPSSADEREDAGAFYVVGCRLAKAFVECPGLRAVQLAEGVLPDAFVTAVGFCLEEEVVESVGGLYDVGVDGWGVKVEEHLRFAFQSAEVWAGIAPIDAVVGDGAVVCEEREIDEILSSLFVEDGLRRPYAGDACKVCAVVAVGEVYAVVFPVNEVA